MLENKDLILPCTQALAAMELNGVHHVSVACCIYRVLLPTIYNALRVLEYLCDILLKYCNSIILL